MNAELHIETIAKDGITSLKSSFCTQPFKLADITESRKEPALKLVIMTSSPGILDGDEYHLKITVAEGSALCLQTQSYQRLFTMKKNASQNMQVRMERNASFHFIPHPVVPHQRSDFSTVNSIYLSSNCRLLWGEVFTCGRKLNGEVFHFTRYHSITEIFLSGRLIIKENVLMKPLMIDVNQLGQMEGYTHQATLIYLNEKAVIKDLMREISDQLITEKEMSFGISAAQANGFVLRLLGYKAEQLYDCLKAIAVKLE